LLEKIRDALESRVPFEEWLLSKPSDEVVGRVRDENNCPIKNFLEDSLLGQQFMVGANSTFVRNDLFIPHPMWVKLLISHVDHCGEGYEPVTVEDLLKYIFSNG